MQDPCNDDLRMHPGQPGADPRCSQNRGSDVLGERSDCEVSLGMKKIDLPTYQAVITVGMQEGYSGPLHTEREVLAWCRSYCDKVGLGVEVHFGTCVYTNGQEPCARISLINYPRFPKHNIEVFEHAEQLGVLLAIAFKQLRFTIVATDVTRMYEMGDVECTSKNDSQ
jgi:hypothetical protein